MRSLRAEIRHWTTRAKSSFKSTWGEVEEDFLPICQRIIVFFIRVRVGMTRQQIPVYFLMTQPELWSHQSIYDAFERDARFVPTVVVFPDGQDSSRKPEESGKRGLSQFRRMGLRPIEGWQEGGNILSPSKILRGSSLVFFDQPVPSLPFSWSPRKIARRALLFYIPYGIKVSPHDRNNFGLELHRFAWRIFAESRFHQEKFQEFNRGSMSRVFCSGYPKFDFISGKRFGTRPQIGIVAPHWSVRVPGWTYSTFEQNSDFLLELAERFKKIQWVLKPHQGLRSQLAKSGVMSEQEYDSYLTRWEKRQNASVHNDSRYFDLFSSADFMITDCGSFLAEFVATGKPLLHLPSPTSAGYNEFGNRVLSVHYQALDHQAVVDFVETVVIGGHDPLGPGREELRRELIPDGEVSIGDKIFREILTSIHMTWSER